MNKREQFLVFTGNGQRCALPVSSVNRIVRSVEVTPVEQQGGLMLGVINVAGAILPVLDLRSAAPSLDIELSDQIIIAVTPARTVALLVKQVEGIRTFSAEEITSAGDLATGTHYVKGIARLSERLVLIVDLERLIAMQPCNLVEEAISSG